MRSLLHDYLARDGNNALYTQRDSVNLSFNIFNRNPRDKQKVMPQFSLNLYLTKAE